MSYEFKRRDVYDLARHLSADVKDKGGKELEFKYCPYCKGGTHNDTKTFSVSLETGQFKCLRGSCNKQGSFITLARDFGFKLDFGTFTPIAKSFKRLPQKPIEEIVVKDEAVQYLKKRGISEDIVKKYGITTQKDNDSVICFPFYDWNGELIMIKYRNTNYKKGITKGSKEWTSKDTKQLLFGIQNVNFENKTLVITEGQIDSLSLTQAGIENALSVPNGKNAFDWINNCWDFLHRFKEIIIFGDCENGSVSLVDGISKRLKKHKLKVIRTVDYKGEKDANDILIKYGEEALKAAIDNAQLVVVNHIIQLADVKPVDVESMPKFSTGIKEIDKTIGGFYMGQYIALTGKRGEGKSTLLSQIVCEAIDQNINTLVYSGELPNYQFKNWIDLQLAGRAFLIPHTHPKTGREYFTVPQDVQEDINNWYRDRLYIMDNGELEENETFFDILEQAVYRYNIKFLCIDNLMTITEYGKLDYYQAQSSTVKRIKELAIAANCCILLVAHERKNGENDVNDNISGSGDISNRADVVMAYRRNKGTEGDYDGYIEISKNRLFGETRLVSNETQSNTRTVKGRIVTSLSNEDRELNSRFGSIHTYFDNASRRIQTDSSPNIFNKYYGWVSDIYKNQDQNFTSSDDLPF